MTSSGRRWGSAAHCRDALVGAVAEEPADQLAYFVERLGSVQHRLVGRDVVVGGAHLDQVERAELHTAELLDLAVAREDPGAVRAELAVLDHYAELDREPEDLGKELDVLVVGQPVRGNAGEPMQLGERVRREQMPVAENLMDDVRLRRVQRHVGMAYVLRGVEAPLLERAVELAERNEPGGG